MSTEVTALNLLNDRELQRFLPVGTLLAIKDFLSDTALLSA